MFIGAGEFASAEVTAEWLLTSVCSHVGDEVVTAAKAEQACVTLEWLLACVNEFVMGLLIGMDLGVPLILIGAGEFECTEAAAEWFLASVRADVGGEVVAAVESFQADVALEWPLAPVDMHVTDQSVTGTEASGTVIDGTVEHWPFRRDRQLQLR